MLYRPSRTYENALRKRGYSLICGIDEAGKGAWAGPIVAACAVLPISVRLKGLRDSKLLTAPKREELYVKICSQALAWSVGIVSNEVIDTVGIIKSNRRAMEQALDKLSIDPDYVLIDGVPFWKPETDHEFVVRGDRHLTSVAAASIIAKVTRDQILKNYHKEYPDYGFAEHKGYGTEAHREALFEFGPCPIHRRSYSPIREFSD